MEADLDSLALPEWCYTSAASSAICRRVTIRSKPPSLMANYSKIKRVKPPWSHIAMAVEGNWNLEEWEGIKEIERGIEKLRKEVARRLDEDNMSRATQLKIAIFFYSLARGLRPNYCAECHDLAKRLSHYLYFFSFLFFFFFFGLTTTRWSVGKYHMTLSQCHNGVTDGHRWSRHKSQSQGVTWLE